MMKGTRTKNNMYKAELRMKRGMTICSVEAKRSYEDLADYLYK